ncbi:MAG TPA: ABC transporter permease [Saprospiraceae bacterium]|nr:ABC transporter permease [Saprospiraceae bacterium]HMQ84513.1 ABC transporter permease [Saprospiraceae bacterium]
MFQNYFKIALRNLSKYKGFSFINIFGLAIGIACSLTICLYIAQELSYEKWNPQADRIFRAYSDINFGGNHMRMAVTGVPVGPDVAREIPEVQTYCRFRDYGSYLVKRAGEDQQNFKEQHVLTVDSTFFEVFPLALKEGDPRSCLTEPNTVALSVHSAEKYFGSAQLSMGQTLVLDNNRNYKVTAVFEDLPANTHFKADLLLSMNGNEEVLQSPPLWAMSNNFHTYILLRKDSDPAVFVEKFNQLSKEKIGQTGMQLMGMTLEEFEATGQHARMEVQKLKDIHLHSDLGVELAPNGSIQYVWMFGTIALFVLFIACINFMNLTTARSAHRAKEIGVRKALGSLRSSLVSQFLMETLVMTVISVILALLITRLALPWFSDLIGVSIKMPWDSPLFWIALLCGIVLVGLMAGSYPAFFLSAFSTVKVLKGEHHLKSTKSNLRSGLVVFQFATSIILIIGTLIIYNQLNYVQNKQLGFNKEQVVMVNDAWALGDNVQAFKQAMLDNPAVEKVTVSSYLPVPSSRSNTTFTKTREFRQDNAINMGNWTVDHDYLNTMQLEMVKGRFFDRAFPSDSTAVVISETAAGILGFEDPIGKKIYTLPDVGPDAAMTPESFQALTIIGVVKDFHWESMRENIGPLCLLLGNSSSHISLRYQAGKTEAVISALEDHWRNMAPGQPFSYQFMDESFAEMYQSEQKIGAIGAGFALLSILISCLGLFGLASFMAEQRTKEIGIRKVLGAQVGGLIALLSKDYLRLVTIALVIAGPIAWWAMNRWLQDFAYRIEISWWVFIVAGVAAVLIALLTVSYQAIKAALANPVKSLRSE